MNYPNFVDFNKNFNSINEYKQEDCIRVLGNESVQDDCLLTICITVYKRIDTLEKALKSAIQQDTDKKYKILILKDYSDESTPDLFADLIESFKNENILYYKNLKNLGMAGTWNRCAMLAKTEYFSLLHDDDILKSNYIEEIYKLITKKELKKLSCIVNNIETIGYPFNSDKSGQITFRTRIKQKIKSFRSIYRKQNSVLNNLFMDNYYGPPTCGIVFNRNDFLESGGFDKTYYPALDWYFMIYFSQKYNVIRLRKSLSMYVWGDNTSSNMVTQEQNKELRKVVINSLVEGYLQCKIINFFLHKDLEQKKESFLYENLRYSFLYRIIFNILDFWFGE